MAVVCTSVKPWNRSVHICVRVYVCVMLWSAVDDVRDVCVMCDVRSASGMPLYSTVCACVPRFTFVCVCVYMCMSVCVLYCSGGNESCRPLPPLLSFCLSFLLLFSSLFFSSDLGCPTRASGSNGHQNHCGSSGCRGCESQRFIGLQVKQSSSATPSTPSSPITQPSNTFHISSFLAKQSVHRHH